MADVLDPNANAGATSEESALDQRTINAVNAAVASHLKRHLSKLPEMIEAQFAPLREQFAARPATEQARPAPQQSTDTDALRQIEELRGQLKKEKDSAQKEKRVAREEKAFSQLRTELTGKVRPEAVDAAAKILFHADRKVVVGDDGNITFKQGDSDFDLREGISEWMKTKDAAMFLPPPSPRVPVQRTNGPRNSTGAPPVNEDPLAKTVRMLSALKGG